MEFKQKENHRNHVAENEKYVFIEKWSEYYFDWMNFIFVCKQR